MVHTSLHMYMLIIPTFGDDEIVDSLIDHGDYFFKTKTITSKLDF